MVFPDFPALRAPGTFRRKFLDVFDYSRTPGARARPGNALPFSRHNWSAPCPDSSFCLHAPAALILINPDRPERMQISQKEISMKARHLSTSALTLLALALGTAFALNVSRAQAADRDVKEVDRVGTTSVGGGFLLGAAVGGPPGAFAGAIAGALFGDRVITGRKNRALEASLSATRDELFAMEQRNADLQAQLLAANGQTGNQNLVASTSREATGNAVLLADSELVLHFRSGSSAVEKLYENDLKEFVALVQAMPDAIVEIYGYADRSGDPTDNLWLSQDRVESVEKALRDLGLRNFAYETTALGEGKPLTATDSFENNFFDRRVVLRLRRESAAIASR
jgi:outer membrane protein OmpA-like peptidoglycan-associated protein